MKLKFKQAVHLGGKDYAYDSVHAVPEDLKPHEHAYLQKLISAGLVHEADEVKEISAETLLERQAKLAEKLMKKHAPKADEASSAPAAEVASDAAPVGEVEEAEEVESEDEAEASESETKDHPARSKNKKKR